MNQPNIMTAGIVGGAIVFAYFYHVRPRRFDHSDRQQVRDFQIYGWIDAYLKLSTFSIALAALHVESPWLLTVHRYWPLRWAGLIVTGFGLCLFLVAMRTLDEQYTPAHIARAPRQLVMTGPYRFVRHPIYAANLALMMGLFLASGSLWIIVNLVILVSYYVPTIIHEESAIRRSFPEFEAYARRTGRVFPLIPRYRREISKPKHTDQ